jgi:hypothetical protein
VLIEREPGCGKLIGRQRAGTVRRLTLERTRYYLFYRVNNTGGNIDIVQLWHSSRRPPKR